MLSRQAADGALTAPNGVIAWLMSLRITITREPSRRPTKPSCAADPFYAKWPFLGPPARSELSHGDGAIPEPRRGPMRKCAIGLIAIARADLWSAKASVAILGL